MSYVAEQARALGLRLQTRRWDDPAHTIDTMDAAIAELAGLRRVAVDSEDLDALQEVLAELTDMRHRLEA
jgi:ribosomal protein L13E